MCSLHSFSIQAEGHKVLLYKFYCYPLKSSLILWWPVLCLTIVLVVSRLLLILWSWWVIGIDWSLNLRFAAAFATNCVILVYCFSYWRFSLLLPVCLQFHCQLHQHVLVSIKEYILGEFICEKKFQCNIVSSESSWLRDINTKFKFFLLFNNVSVSCGFFPLSHRQVRADIFDYRLPELKGADRFFGLNNLIGEELSL